MSQSSGFQGVDVSGVEKVIREFTSALQKVERTISYVQALIVALRAAGFFTGGASVAYANYLQHTVLPWLRKVAMALQMAIQVLRTQLRDQEHASSLQTLGIEQLGYRTPQLPTSDTRAFPVLDLPTAGAPSGSGGAVVEAATVTGGAVTGGSLDHPRGATLAPVTAPSLGGGAATGGAGTAPPVSFPDRPAPATPPPPSAPVGAAGGNVGTVVGSGLAATGAIGAGAAFAPGSASGTGATAGGVTGGHGGGGRLAGGPVGGPAGGLGSTLVSRAGGGDGAIGADAGQPTIGAADADPVVRSRSAIADQPTGFAGRASLGGSAGGEVSVTPLRDEVVVPGAGAGAIGAGLAAAGAIPLALKRDGRRLLGEDGDDLFGGGDDTGTDR